MYHTLARHTYKFNKFNWVFYETKQGDATLR